MKENSDKEGRFSLDAHGLGTVTENMVRRRAKELAQINGRSEGQLLDSDLEEARRELTGEERLVPEETPAEQLPEEDRWVAVPESTGQQAATVPPADEQTFPEKLMEEGMEDAEQDQMIRAIREGLPRERR